MIHSMTGYGKAEGIIGNKKVTVQLKSLNSKQADITVKVPSIFKEFELTIRKQLSTALQRGKIELYLSYEAAEKESKYEIDEALFERYYHQLHNLNEKFNLDDSTVLQSILKMPEILKSKEEELEENSEGLTELVEEAIKAINSFRIDEGKTLEADLQSHITAIDQLLSEALQHEDERAQTVRTRLEANLAEAQQTEKVNADRFEQEMIYYLEKYDISEEKVRLKAHCDYFTATMKDAAGQGKKLGFISQEIGREINTLGSKANHAQMQKLVVQMKDQLEKIKEQVLNVL